MSPYCGLQHEHVVAYAGTAVVPPMTTSSLRLGKWLTEYAHLMRVIRSDAGRIWSGMAELFELYFLHTFHTFGDITIAALMSTQQQRQVLHELMSHHYNPARPFLDLGSSTMFSTWSSRAQLRI